MATTTEALPASQLTSTAEQAESIAMQGVLGATACHSVTDFYSAFLAPLLPSFIERFALSKTQAGLLTVFYQGPSLLQPLLGHLADSVGLRYLLILGPTLGGIFVSLMGIAPSYFVIAMLLMLAGLSSAGMHSVGAPTVGELSKKRLGRGMSIWMVGGELGFATGAFAVVAVVKRFGLGGTPWLMILGFVTSIVAFLVLRRVPPTHGHVVRGVSMSAALRFMSPVLVPVSIMVLLRSFLDACLSTYLPTFLTGEGSDLLVAGGALTIMELAGVVGALLCGYLSDRFGRKVVLGTSVVVAPLLMLAFLLTQGAWHFAILLAVGFTAYGAAPVILATLQGAFPDNRALVSGAYMAVAFALRSGVVLMVGILSDLFGMRNAFYASAVISLAALALIPFLPATNQPMSRPAP